MRRPVLIAITIALQTLAAGELAASSRANSFMGDNPVYSSSFVYRGIAQYRTVLGIEEDLLAIDGVHALGANVTASGILEKFNKNFSSWIEEADLDSYGFLTPGDIALSWGCPIKKGAMIGSYLDMAADIDIDGDLSTVDAIMYRDAGIAALLVRDGLRFTPIFSMDFHDPDNCFITYPSDHYRVFIEPVICRNIATPIVDQIEDVDRVREKYNKVFSSWIAEADGDGLGLLTPGDILASKGDARTKAIDIQKYFLSLGEVDLDGNDSTADAFSYRDGNAIAVSIRSDKRIYSIFSIDIHDLGDCGLTLASDVGREVPIDEAQCRLIRAAHPLLGYVEADYYDPENWIEGGDENVVVDAGGLPAYNAKLIEQANGIWKKLLPGEPKGFWNFAKLPSKMKRSDVLGTKIVAEMHPFIRPVGGAALGKMTADDLKLILDGMDIPGKIEIGKVGEKDAAILTIDEKFAASEFEPIYGWTTRRADLRGLPTYDSALGYLTDDDQWQYSNINAEQPVAIVGDAVDKYGFRWYHVLTTRVVGWIEARYVGKSSRDEIGRLLGQDVLTVVVPSFELDGRIFDMGTRIRTSTVGANRKTLLSDVDGGGRLVQKEISVPSSAVSKNIGSAPLYDGVVPFSRANFTRLLFQYLGTPWGWGGERRGDDIEFPVDGGRRQLYIDCSGIMANAMSAMGIDGIARNSWFQINQGRTLWAKGDDGETRDIEDALGQSGHDAWLVGLMGHVVFYLGKTPDGDYMILHSPGHFREFVGDDYIRIGDGMAVVSKLGINGLDEKYTVVMSPK